METEDKKVRRTRVKSPDLTKEDFAKQFATSAQRKSLKALDTLHRIATTGRAEMARVAAAKAIIERAVPNEQKVVVENTTSYSDLLREIADRMRSQPLTIEQDPPPVLVIAASHDDE